MIFVSEDSLRKKSAFVSDLRKKQEKKGSAHGVCLQLLSGFLPKWAGQNPKSGHIISLVISNLSKKIDSQFSRRKNK